MYYFKNKKRSINTGVIIFFNLGLRKYLIKTVWLRWFRFTSVMWLWIDSAARSESKTAELENRAVVLLNCFSLSVFLTNTILLFYSFMWSMKLKRLKNQFHSDSDSPCCKKTIYIFNNAVLPLQSVRVSTQRSEHQEEALRRRDDDHQTENQQWCVILFTLLFVFLCFSQHQHPAREWSGLAVFQPNMPS